MGQVPDDLKQLGAVELEVDTLRQRTQDLVSELERRLRARSADARRTLDRVKGILDVRGQFERHPGAAIGFAAAAATGIGLTIFLLVRRYQHSQRWAPRLQRRVQNYRALLANPQRALRRQPPIGNRVLGAVLVAGATTLVKALVTLSAKRVLEPRYQPSRMLPPRYSA